MNKTTKYLLLISILLLNTACGFNSKFKEKNAYFYITSVGVTGANEPRNHIRNSLSDLPKRTVDNIDEAVLQITVSEYWEKGAIQQDSRIERFNYVLSSVATITLPSNQPFQKRNYKRGFYTPNSSAFGNKATQRELVEALSLELADEIRSWVYDHQYGVPY